MLRLLRSFAVWGTSAEAGSAPYSALRACSGDPDDYERDVAVRRAMRTEFRRFFLDFVAYLGRGLLPVRRFGGPRGARSGTPPYQAPNQGVRREQEAIAIAISAY